MDFLGYDIPKTVDTDNVRRMKDEEVGALCPLVPITPTKPIATRAQPFFSSGIQGNQQGFPSWLESVMSPTKFTQGSSQNPIGEATSLKSTGYLDPNRGASWEAGSSSRPRVYDDVNSSETLLLNDSDTNFSDLLRFVGMDSGTSRTVPTPSSCSGHIPHYGYPVSCHPGYNFSSPQKTLTSMVSNNSISFSQFEPVTPHQSVRAQQYQGADKGNAYLAQGPNMEKRNTIDLSHEGSFQQSVVDSPSPFVSESFTEMDRTPQQKPKRKKVRPKVVKEAEHKRTPKANNNLNTKQSTTTESLTRKRKYVRRNGNKSPNVLPAEAVEEVTTDYAATSCKRSLNFNLEDHSNKVDQQDGLLHNIVDDRSTLSFGIERTSLNTQALMTGSSGTIYGQQSIQELEVVDDSLADVLFDLNCSLMPQKTAPATPPPIRKEPARGRLNIFSCNSCIGIGSPCQEVGESSCPPGIQDHPTESFCGVMKNRNHCSNHENGVPYLFHDDTRYMDNENITYKSHLRLAEVQEATMLQREYNHNETEANFMNKAGKSYISLPVYVEMLQQYQQQGKSSDLQQQFSETCKKKRTQNDQYPVSCSISTMQPILHGAREATECRMNDASTSHFASQTSNKGMTVQYGNVNEQRLHKTETSMYDVQSHANSKGQPEPAWPLRDPADELVRKSNRLEIHDGNNMVQEQYALVPYGGDGQMVPYEGRFDTVKKRKHRARVDLDPETERVWKLLMGTDTSNGVEETNEDKEKWWQKERHVLHGRAHSFIGRMHLIQGDRRFTKWKGSVLDSIIGVFLTQNVSDHLSSSAFMSLAARFPLKSIVVEEHDVCQDSVVPMNWQEKTLKRPISDQGAATLYESENTEKRECGTSNVSFGSNTRGGTLGITSSQSSLVSSQSAVDSSMAQRTSEEGVSYQNSTNLSFPCTDERIKWCSETDPLSRCASNSFSNPISFTDLLQSVDTTMLQGYSGKQRTPDKVVEPNSRVYSSDKVPSGTPINPSVPKEIPDKEKKKEFDWDSLRKEIPQKGLKKKRDKNAMDSLDWEAVRCADVGEIAEAIKERGMKNMLAERINDFLNRLVKDHGCIDMEWLRDVPPDKAKEYLLSIRGLGLKSVECVRLLTLHQVAFPVDTNVARIAVRLGWVPLQPLPESLQLHQLELYPALESIQKYLWPRLCTLDQPTLYELHYQMITFGKVFCTKSKPNCNACPMRAECKHFASAFASSRLSLPGPEEKGMVASFSPISGTEYSATWGKLMPLLEADSHFRPRGGEPLVEEPASPVYSSTEVLDTDIEDAFYESPNVNPSIEHNLEEFTLNFESFMQENYKGLQDGEVSNALVAVTPQAASITIPRLKNVSRLRTEHYVYELPDDHRLLIGVPRRDPDDHCKYLLAIWTPGETAESIQPPEGLCVSQASGNLCNEKTCFSCNSKREANTQTVRGTLLIPCRSAMRGNFPLNGTYFQVNEVFADNESSLKPISVPREWIWNLPRRTVLFGTSIPAIFKDQSTEEIQNCFRKGYVCVRGFDQKTRAPRRLLPRLHFPASMLAKYNAATKKD